MSHFSVLVIGDNPENQLAPFDENLENTFVDKTEEYLEEYNEKKVQEFYCSSNSSWGMQITKELFDFITNGVVGAMRRYTVTRQGIMSYLELYKKYRGYYTLEDGKRCEGGAWFEVTEVISTEHPDHNICFTGIVTIRIIEPPKKIPLKEKYPNYNDYLQDWHGISPDKQGYWINENAKWDWYSLGGRWTGYFKLKPNAAGDIGEPGAFGNAARVGYVDSALKGAIDFEGMKMDAMEEARERYQEVLSMFNGNIPKLERTWDDILADESIEGIDNKRDLYHSQPSKVRALEVARAHEEHFFDLEEFQCTEDEYAESISARVITPFAVVKDGKWYQKGEMGWFGITHDEKDQGVWVEEVQKLLDSLADDTALHLYDCHI